ncbi:portal protein [Polynucleobacter asymbioticus]|uniref:Portal protein n=1 Tax=Polynucleobacter asymbioticus TaxID=576611 RepID=A0AAC9NIR4_9BURK|nr:hypothetical protein [Polynucleobacter asymbioticus]APB99030.1 hypothetical protein A4F89_06660 [Polynucleobacter asymbioticus]APC01332.1 hypothetical protein AOC25_06760 [Polynucleobacter asymbioticus]
MSDFPETELSVGDIPPESDDQVTEPIPELMQQDRLAKLGRELAKRRQEWVRARRSSGIERRWKNDWDQYNGLDPVNTAAASMMDSVQQGGFPAAGRKDSKPQRSKVFVNITRPKTNSAVARLQEMLFPTDDRNWGLTLAPVDEPSSPIKPFIGKSAAPAAASPVNLNQAPQVGSAPAPSSDVPVPQNDTPVAQGQQAPQGQPGQPGPQAPQAPKGSGLPPSDGLLTDAENTALLQRQASQKALTAMEEEIDSQLDEAHYNAIGRQVLHYAGVMGTGVIKGPIVVNRMRKMWQPMGDIHVLKMVEEKKPSLECLDPRHIFPDPSCGNDIHNGSGIFEYQDYTPKRVRELSKQPGYIAESISKVLEEGPAQDYDVELYESMTKEEQNEAAEDRKHFKVWSYWGDFEPEDLRAAGVDVADGELAVVSGCVIMVNDTVIKAFENPLETGDFPYDFFTWEANDKSPFGYGVPHLIRTQQRVLNAGWRQIMDNASLSVGPQVILKTSAIEPADGVWEMTGRKIWRCIDQTANVQDAMHLVDIPMHIQELQAISKMAMDFIDLESAVPQIIQGDSPGAPETVGGLTILMNNANVVLRRIIKQFDDNLTVPLLTRFYDWNMAYNPKKSIKGDYIVDAKGSTALLVRDMQNQALLQLGQYQQSPIISGMVNWDEWFKESLKANHIDTSRILKNDDEIKAYLAQQQANQPLPPQVQVATINANSKMQALQATQQYEMKMAQGQNGESHPSIQSATINAQAKLQESTIRSNAAQAVAQAKVQGELAYAEKMLQIETQNGNARAQERQDQMQLEILRYANQHKISLEEIKAGLAKTAMVEQTKREALAVGNQINANEHASKQAHEANQSALDREHDMTKHLLTNLPAPDQTEEPQPGV